MAEVMTEYCGCNYPDCAVCGQAKAERERDEARQVAWEIMEASLVDQPESRADEARAEWIRQYPWLKKVSGTDGPAS